MCRVQKMYAVCNRKSARHIDHAELHVVYSALGFRFAVIVSLFSILISLYRREDFIQWIPQMLTLRVLSLTKIFCHIEYFYRLIHHFIDTK